MRPRILLLAIITVLLSAVTVTLIATGFNLPDRANPADPEIETKQNLDEGFTPPEDSRMDLPSPVDTEESQVNEQQDGKLILENHCSQCHPTQLLEKTVRSRAEWETILKQMEVFDVQLSKTDKVGLLNYLVGTEK